MPFVPDDGPPAMFSTSGSMSTKSVEAMTTEAQKLVTAAKAGQFKVTEEGVRPMLEAIRECQIIVTRMLDYAMRLTQKPTLGSSDYVTDVSAQVSTGGTSAEQSVLQLQELLIQLEEAFQRAAETYEENEQVNQQSFQSGSSSFRAV